MTEQSAFKIIGKLDDISKSDVAQALIHSLVEAYPEVEGEIYLGYPIYIDEVANRRVCVDMAIISRIGIYIVNILTSPVTDYGQMQDDIYAKVETKFKKQPFLFKKRSLVFDFFPVSYSTADITPIDGYPLAKSIDEFLAFIDQNKVTECYSDDLLGKILSGIQEAYGINIHRDRRNVSEGTKAFSIGQMSCLIEKYDTRQMEAILSDTTGIQRIRGMAGSGKTIVLARKAVELHTAHPDWNIVVTYSTRTLKDQLTSLISRFYAAKNDGAKYNEAKLKVMQSWGSARAKGVYYEVCLRHNIEPMNVTEAKAKFNTQDSLFSKLCGELLISVGEFQKMYDCILIDEAQDFDKNYLQLCLKILGSDKRLVYAYDELQTLSEETMPTPEQTFGCSIKYDTPLTVCYRNQGRAIVTAHAIGMGLYRKDGLLQLPGSSSVWEAIGYFSDNPIVEGKPATLYRTNETSPELLKVSPEDIIEFLSYENPDFMFESLLDMLKDDLVANELLPRDIMIIDMDGLYYQKNRQALSTMQYVKNYKEGDELLDDKTTTSKYDFKIHTAGAATPEDFFRDDSVVYSSVRRAKGNETFMVYIVNAQKCVNSLQRRSDRNGLFTAITRSKGWVRVLGHGEDMKALVKEFEEIKSHDFKLHFDQYPDKETQAQIFLNNRDVGRKDVEALSSTKLLIEKLTAEERVSKLQLMQELFGMSRDELLKELSRNSRDE